MVGALGTGDAPLVRNHSPRNDGAEAKTKAAVVAWSQEKPGPNVGQARRQRCRVRVLTSQPLFPFCFSRDVDIQHKMVE